jgi:glycopeptide antibiotics resistance protein
MHILHHRVPGAVVPAFLFLCIVGLFLWAWLWQRMGPIRSSLWAALLVWGGLVLALTLSPKRKFRGQADKARSCDLTLIPNHLMGAFTNSQRALSVALYLPLGVLLILAARHYERILAGAAIVLAPVGVETLQYAFPRLRRTCQSVDVYDAWTGLALGVVIGLVVITAVRRTPWGRDRAEAKHRLEVERPNAVEVVKVFWPPDEAAVRGEPPVVKPSTFVPSGAKVSAPPVPRPETARQAKRERAHQARDVAAQDERDRRVERAGSGSASGSGLSEGRAGAKPSGAADRRS